MGAQFVNGIGKIRTCHMDGQPPIYMSRVLSPIAGQD